MYSTNIATFIYLPIYIFWQIIGKLKIDFIQKPLQNMSLFPFLLYISHYALQHLLAVQYHRLAKANKQMPCNVYDQPEGLGPGHISSLSSMNNYATKWETKRASLERKRKRKGERGREKEVCVQAVLSLKLPIFTRCDFFWVSWVSSVLSTQCCKLPH